MEKVKAFFPILQWFPSYGPKDVFGDMIAGLTVALAAIPQSMAYAVLAGIRPQYGLYSSFLAPFVYIFIGSCRQVTVGPTAVSALLAYETCGNDFPDCVILLSFYAGVIQILLTVLRVGSFVALISDPVTSGFTSGAALTIASSQFKSFFGFNSTKETKFLGYLEAVFENWSSISLADVTMGVTSLVVLLILQNLHHFVCTNQRSPWLLRILWVITVSRNVLVVMVASLVAFYWGTVPPFKLTGNVDPGLPPVTVPKFELPNHFHWGNETEVLSFSETVANLGSGPALVALVAILQNVAITKAYGSGQRISGNQELFTLGVTSILGGFISAQPVSASFSRSALNDASGVRTQFSGFFTGLAIILSLILFTPAFHYIPRATLAAVIISAVLMMIDVRTPFQMWKVSKIDSVTYSLTFLSAILFNMEIGIGVGVGFSILVFLFRFVNARYSEELTSEEGEPLLQYVVLRCPTGVHFPDVDALRKSVNSYRHKYTKPHPIVLDCAKWTSFDYTGVAAITSLIRTNQQIGISMVLLHPTDVLINGLKLVGMSDEEIVKISCDNERNLGTFVKKLRNENELTIN